MPSTATSYSPLPPSTGKVTVLPTGTAHSLGASRSDASATTSINASALAPSASSVSRTTSVPVRLPAV